MFGIAIDSSENQIAPFSPIFSDGEEWVRSSLVKRTPEVIDLSSPATQDLSGCAYVAKKVAFLFVKYVLVAPVLLSLSLVFNTVTIIPKLYNYFSVNNLKQKVEDHKRRVLQTALDVQIHGKTMKQWTYGELIRMTARSYLVNIPKKHRVEIRQFIHDVKRIEYDIRYGRDTSEIREDIDQLMGSNIYQALKETDHPAVEFLQILCMKYIGGKGTEESDVFEEYGREVVGDLDGKTEFTLGELADVMDERTGVGVFGAYQRNGLASTIIWVLSHPFDFLRSTTDEWDPLVFNSHEGNPDVYGYDFVLPKASDPSGKEKRMHFYYGPGPTGDRLYNEGYLVYLDKKGLFERRTNHQNLHHRSEALRVYEMRRYEEAHPDSLRFLSLSFDTPLMKTPPRLHQEGPVQHFMSALKEHYCEERAHRVMHADPEVENGVYIGPDVLGDKEVERALTVSEEIFSRLSEGNDYWDQLMSQGAEGEKRLARMMILGTHGVIGLGSIYKALQDSPAFDERLDADLATCRASGACKQDIDRAVVENITERIFFRLLTNDGPITKQELDSIVGAVLARAYIVEGRLIQWKRYEILSDLLHFVGTPENTKKLSACLRGYVASMP
ncbi:MAG: hypothetical protein H7A41_03990 [Chlamydiales bacterium]|nr:hypothetical protein [Chlamydiales bacterium]